jgi:hypothetical protein
MSTPTTPRRGSAGSSPTAPHEIPTVQAPTLLRFWLSDARVLPGRRAPRWAGRIAFWLGLLSVILLGFEELLGIGGGLLGQVAEPFSVVAGLFAIVSLVAGIGRGSGFFGAVFALLGNVSVWAWLAAEFA